jgi:signal transduction histidine kinase
VTTTRREVARVTRDEALVGRHGGHAAYATAMRLGEEERTRSRDGVEALDVLSGLLAEVESGGGAGRAFYDRLCQGACQLTSMQRAVLFAFDEAEEAVRAVGAHGVDRDRLAALDVTLDDGPMARTALIEDRVVEADDLEDQLTPQYARMFGLTTLTCTPLSAGRRWFGVLFADRGGGRFRLTDAERHTMWTLGKTAALAMAARVATREEEHARRLAERIELTREVHDRVLQRLFGVSLALAGDGPLPAEVRARSRQEVQDALAELRSALRRPLARRRRAVGGSLRRAVSLLQETAPEQVHVAWPAGVEVPVALEPLARSVLSEAVRNARKHARPTRLDVRVEREDDALVVEVVNDGVPGRQAPESGMGLRLAAFEALAHGGLVEFGALDGGRWRVKLVVPAETAPPR